MATIDPDRQGNCYPLAYDFLMLHEDAELVHGTLSGGRDHAWVEWPNTVYDPVLDVEFDKDFYYAHAGAAAEQRYTPDEAEVLSEHHHTYGPWTP